MLEETPSFGLAAKLWWAHVWRATLLALLAGLGVGIVLGIVSRVIGLSEQFSSLLIILGGAFVGFYLSVRVYKRLMTKGFGPYRLAVLRK